MEEPNINQTNQSSNGANTVLIVIVIIILLVGGYFIFGKNDKTMEDSNNDAGINVQVNLPGGETDSSSDVESAN